MYESFGQKHSSQCAPYSVMSRLFLEKYNNNHHSAYFMFVRVKKIKGKEYAYLVQNEWTPWGSRQKVAKYLGKAHKIERMSENTKQLPAGFQQTVIESIAQELENHGFSRQDTNLVKENFTVSMNDKTIRFNGKRAVLGMNEGYLCDETIQQLLTFIPEEKAEANAKKLANLVLEAGLKLNSEQFLHLFEQVKNNIKEA